MISFHNDILYCLNDNLVSLSIKNCNINQS